MAKIGRLPRPAAAPPSQYNPYDLVTIFVGTQEVKGRPYEFDSEPVDQYARNANGQFIKPIRAMTACPNCGAGIDVDLRQGWCVGCGQCGLGQPPPPPPPLADPFCNPLTDGRITEVELIGDGAVAVQALAAALAVTSVPTQPPKAPKPASKHKPAAENENALGSVLDLGPEPE